MKVKELIKQLLDEDQESEVYVRAIDNHSGDIVFGDVDGIATSFNSYKPTGTFTATTLVLNGCMTKQPR